MGSARQTQFLKYILCIILKYKCSKRTTMIHMNKLFLFFFFVFFFYFFFGFQLAQLVKSLMVV